jgi:hypothetical protein
MIDDRSYKLRAVPARTFSQMKLPVRLKVEAADYLDSVDLISE